MHHRSQLLRPLHLASARCLRLGLAVAYPTALCLASCASADAAEGVEGVEGAEIRYTEYGIPHVKADDYAGLGLGLGYAQARDNLCKIELGMLALDARLSRYFGPDATSGTLAPGSGNNLRSDLYFEGLKAGGDVERWLGQAEPLGPRQEVRELVRGYVRGFNRALTDSAGFECQRAEWLRPMTELDVYRRAYAITTWLGTGQASGAIVSAEPPALSVEPQSSLDEARVGAAGALDARYGRPGSNAVALGANATETGFGMNVANPHLGWDWDMRWWQAQLTVPGQIDVSGATLIGLPLVVMGHTAQAAWSITMAEKTQRYTLYELSLVDGAPTSYWVDGRAEAMVPRSVSVPVRRDDGQVESVSRTEWWTRYGAVVGPAFLPWTAGTGQGDGRAYAFFDPNASNLRMLDTLFALNQAGSVGDVLAAVRETQGVPWWTVIAADAEGETLFSQVQVVANVTDELAAACVPERWRELLHAERTFILDGSRSECSFRTDPDAVEPGILGPGTLERPRMPVLLGADYVSNSNDSHWLPNGSERIEHMPLIIGDEGTERSLRSRDVWTEIEEQLAQGPFTRSAMADLVLSNRSRAAELGVDDSLRMCAGLSDGAATSSDGRAVDVRLACAVLAGWDRRMNVESRGALLFDRYWRRANQLAAESGAELWTVAFDPVDPLHTPRGLDVEGPIFSAALADAALELGEAGIALDAPLGDHQYVVRGGERIPLGGGGGDDGLGVFNILNAAWDPARGYTGTLDGSTYLHVVSFDGTPCPDAVMLLTYSQSDEPASPHHADQTLLYSQKRWVESRFCEADILASPALEVVFVPGVGEGG